MKRKEPFYRSLISDLAGRCSGSTEVVGALLQPLTGHVTAEMLGFPEADMEKLSFWAARIMENGDDLFTIAGEVFGYFSEVHADRLTSPRDDIPSLLATLEIDGRPIEPGEFLGTMATLFVGGLDTTVSAGAYILEWLAQHPGAREWLRADLDRVPAAVEEFLRYFTPLPTLRRVATADAVIGGQDIAEGDTVQLHFMAANHDPERFCEPNRVILDREPNRHVAFGSGIHRCLGSAVARQELRLLVEDLLNRFSSWELDPARPVVRYEGIVRGIRELWLRFPEQEGR